MEKERTLAGIPNFRTKLGITKVYPGAKGDGGSDAVSHWLVPSVDKVQKSATGVLTPTSVTCAKMKQAGAGAASTSDKSLFYQLSTGAETAYVGAVAIGSATWIEFVLKDGATVLDRERVPVVADGAAGKDGLKGDKGEQGIQGLRGLQGGQGLQGIPGAKGADGKTTYFHIKYAPVANPTAAQMSEIPNTFIGTYVDFTSADSNDPTNYKWARLEGLQGVSGEKGIPGVNGANGQTSYLHIKYSDNGTSFTANSGETPGAWIGQYADFTEADSTTFSKYAWTKVKGDKGDNAPLLKVQFSVNGTSGWHTTYADGDKYRRESNDNGATWSGAMLMYKEGANGKDGINGSTGADGKKTPYTDFSYGYGLSQPTKWSDAPPAKVDGQHLWERIQKYTPKADNSGWTLASTSYAIINEYIEIGGVNLATGLNYSYNPVVGVYGAIFKIYTLTEIGLAAGEIVTYSGELFGNGNILHAYLVFRTHTDEYISEYTGNPTVAWGKSVLTVNIPANTGRVHVGILQGSPSEKNNYYVVARKLKLERGNKATDWSPSPEDVQAQIDVSNAKIAEMADDNKLTPSEKQQTAIEWERIRKEHATNHATATSLGVATGDLSSAYNTLSSLMGTVLANLTTSSNINGVQFRTAFASWYDKNAAITVAIRAANNALGAADATSKKLDAICSFFGGSADRTTIETIMNGTGAPFEVKSNVVYMREAFVQKLAVMNAFIDSLTVRSLQTARSRVLINDEIAKFGNAKIDNASGAFEIIDPITGKIITQFGVDRIPSPDYIAGQGGSDSWSYPISILLSKNETYTFQTGISIPSTIKTLVPLNIKASIEVMTTLTANARTFLHLRTDKGTNPSKRVALLGVINANPNTQYNSALINRQVSVSPGMSYYLELEANMNLGNNSEARCSIMPDPTMSYNVVNAIDMIKYGLGGLAFAPNTANFFSLYEDNGVLFTTIKGQTNMPGVLAKARISATNVISKSWGKYSITKVEGLTVGGANKRVFHKQINSSYSAICTAFGGGSTPVVYDETPTYVDLYATGGFNIMLIGDN